MGDSVVVGRWVMDAIVRHGGLVSSRQELISFTGRPHLHFAGMFISVLETTDICMSRHNYTFHIRLLEFIQLNGLVCVDIYDCLPSTAALQSYRLACPF
jgi:hypothetical protein